MKKKSIFWDTFLLKKRCLAGGKWILSFVVETISGFRPVSKKKPETFCNCQSFTETGWKKKGLFCKKPGKRTVSTIVNVWIDRYMDISYRKYVKSKLLTFNRRGQCKIYALTTENLCNTTNKSKVL